MWQTCNRKGTIFLLLFLLIYYICLHSWHNILDRFLQCYILFFVVYKKKNVFSWWSLWKQTDHMYHHAAPVVFPPWCSVNMCCWTESWSTACWYVCTRHYPRNIHQTTSKPFTGGYGFPFTLIPYMHFGSSSITNWNVCMLNVWKFQSNT